MPDTTNVLNVTVPVTIEYRVSVERHGEVLHPELTDDERNLLEVVMRAALAKAAEL